jgi:hypothetical protein
MATNLAALFEHPQDAERARAELLAAGFPEERVRLTGPAAAEGLRAAERLEQFFESLFSPAHTRYTEVFLEGVRRGGRVVTVHGTDGEQCEQACEILERHAPVDVDAREAEGRRAPLRPHAPNAPDTRHH